MNTTQTLSHDRKLPSAHALYDEYVEDLMLENATLKDQLRDLAVYKDMAVAALEAVSHQTARNQQLAKRIDDLNRQLRELMTGRRHERDLAA